MRGEKGTAGKDGALFCRKMRRGLVPDSGGISGPHDVGDQRNIPEGVSGDDQALIVRDDQEEETSVFLMEEEEPAAQPGLYLLR